MPATNSRLLEVRRVTWQRAFVTFAFATFAVIKQLNLLAR